MSAIPVTTIAAAPPVHERTSALVRDTGACMDVLASALKVFRLGHERPLYVVARDVIAGRRGKAFLRLDVASETLPARAARSRTFIVEIHADDDGRKILWRLKRRHAAAGTGLAGYLRDRRILVREFTLDYRLPTLPIAADPSHVAPALTQLLGEAVPHSLTVAIVRYVPEKRCLLRYAWTDGEGRSRRVLAKVYPEGDDLASGTVQAALHARRADHRGLDVPRVIGLWREASVVVQEEVAGRPLYDVMRGGGAEVFHQALAADAIHALHATTLVLGRTHGLDEELRVVTQAVERSFLRGAERAIAGDWLALLTHRRAALADGALCPSHRDFYDKQLLVEGGRAVLIDFDTASLAPVEIDLANHVAHLRLRALQGYWSTRDAGQHADAFLTAYREAGGTWHADRFEWVLATTWLRLACVYAARLAWPDLPGDLLVDVGRVLRGGHAWRAARRGGIEGGCR